MSPPLEQILFLTLSEIELKMSKAGHTHKSTLHQFYYLKINLFDNMESFSHKVELSAALIIYIQIQSHL